MPTIFEKDGFRFFFYSNDHHPIHVSKLSVTEEAKPCSTRLAKLSCRLRWVTLAVKLTDAIVTKATKLLAEENKKLIIEKWHEYLD